MGQNWSQANHLGNVDGTAKGGQTDSYEWWIPDFEALTDENGWKCHEYNEDVTSANDDGGATTTKAVSYVRGVMRLRYNISTMDYDPYTTNSSWNNDPANGVISPITQNPTVDIGTYMQGFRLAINTAQTGRTFSDRSHVFNIMKKPDYDGNSPQAAQSQVAAQNLLNVNVRGKRGNIVQTFPAVEYDFEPNDFYMEQGQCVHFQWGGSNTHNNGNPAGDGQAGDAGEGKGGSDRSNIIQLLDKNSTYPAPLDKAVVTDFFEKSKCYQTYTGNAVSSGNTGGTAQQNLQAKDCQIYLMSAGYFTGYDDVGNGNELDVLLNNTPASMRGLTVCPQEAGEFDFTCTRNNNFSNRDQKLTITVTTD